jgi:hypothetical protein
MPEESEYFRPLMPPQPLPSPPKPLFAPPDPLPPPTEPVPPPRQTLPPPPPLPSRPQPLSPVLIALVSGTVGALLVFGVFAIVSLSHSIGSRPLGVGGVGASTGYGASPRTLAGATPTTSAYSPPAATMPTTTTAPLKAGLPPGAQTSAVQLHGEFSFKSGSGDYIGGGATVDYKTPAYPVTVGGSLGAVTVSAGGWTLDLAAPKGYQLTPGTTYYGATRYPFNTGIEPGLSVAGNGRGCNQDFGRFTIKAISSGPDGSITRLNATFTQTCESKTAPALTGFVKYSG